MAECKKCKKKKPVTQLEPLVEEVIFPTIDEIKYAYIEMSSAGGLKPELYDRVNTTYKAIFNEDLLRNCGSCGQRQFRKFTHYIKNVLKIKI